MTSLAQLSQERLSGQLPSFPGRNLAEQLQSGRAAAEAALRKYVPDLTFNVGESEAVVHEVDTWVERNRSQLADALDPVKNPGNSLPEELKLQLGATKTQQFLIASFTQAAVGMGPWMGGEVARVASTGTNVAGTVVNTEWARRDAAMRLQTFGMIVRMELNGDLAAIFRPSAAAGVGALATGTLVLIAVVTAILAAAVVLLVVYDRHLQRNNDLLREMCTKAEREGNDALVSDCIRAAQGLQSDAFSSFGKELARGLLIIGGSYAALTWGVPLLAREWKKRRSRS